MLLKWQLNYIFIDQMWARLCQGSVFGRAKVALLGARMGSGSEVCSKIWCEKSIGYVWLHIYLDFQLTYHIFGFPLWTSPSFLEHKGSLFKSHLSGRPVCLDQWWNRDCSPLELNGGSVVPRHVPGETTQFGWREHGQIRWEKMQQQSATSPTPLWWIIIIFLIKMAVIWGHIWVYQTDKPKSSYKKVQADKALHVPAPKLRSCAFPCFRQGTDGLVSFGYGIFHLKTVFSFILSYYKVISNFPTMESRLFLDSKIQY